MMDFGCPFDSMLGFSYRVYYQSVSLPFLEVVCAYGPEEVVSKVGISEGEECFGQVNGEE